MLRMKLRMIDLIFVVVNVDRVFSSFLLNCI